MSVDEPDRGVRRRALDWVAEAALASLTVSVTVGMTRLFSDASFLRDAIVMGLASHLVAAAARRVRLALAPAALLSGCCLAVAATLLRYGDTAWFVLPTRDTLLAARGDLIEGWNVASAASAPIAPVPGLVLVVVAALWGGAFLADTSAFRLRAPMTAVAPAFGVFIVAAAAGVGDDRIRQSALFCAAVAAVQIALWLRDRGADAWVGPDRWSGPRALGRAGAAAASLAVLAAVTTGPMLPGAGAEPWIDVESFELRDGSRVVLSPLVQVRSRLVQRSEVELFTVAVPQESRQYWRLMSLDEFDGAAWRSRSRFRRSAGPFAATLHPSAEGALLAQEVTITRLGNDYLPAAHEIRRVLDDGGVAMEHEASSGTLIKTRLSAASGPSRFSYVVESVVPSIEDPDVLHRAEAAMLEESFLAFNTAIPDAAREAVQAEARRITAGSDSDYRRALELQDYFLLDGRFRYDLDVAEYHGVEDLEEFLFEVRAGYCEQFAAAYAVMARSIGLPARVAVGFTWGEWDPERGAYAVRGEHAHAWPEVYFAGTGWVRFEPTPGRGAPDDFAVTGRVPGQSGSDPETAAPTVEAQAAEPVPASGTGGTRGPARSGPGDPTGRSAGASASVEAPATGVGAPLLGVFATAALGLAAGLVAGLRHLGRRRRRARLADDPAGLIELAWNDAVGALTLIRLAPKSSETPVELARRVRSECPAAGPIGELAELATLGRYARDTSPLTAVRARLIASRVVAACRRQMSVRHRLAAALNPKTLFA